MEEVVEIKAPSLLFTDRDANISKLVAVCNKM